MRDDFQLIKCSFPDFPYLNVYPIGDVHLGSRECDEELLQQWVEMVENDPYGIAVIVGDMMNMGIKSSVSNVYEERMTPAEQKEACYQLLLPIKDKVWAACSGNHEYRVVREVGTNPLYDVFCRLQIEDRYRENACFIKLTVGKSGKNPNTYGLVLTHGKSKTKDLDWTYAVDGADVFISGHIHLGTHQPLSKIKMDLTHERVKPMTYQHIVVLPFQQYGGYAIRSKYKPNATGNFQCVVFDGTSKHVGYTYT